MDFMFRDGNEVAVRKRKKAARSAQLLFQNCLRLGQFSVTDAFGLSRVMDFMAHAVAANFCTTICQLPDFIPRKHSQRWKLVQQTLGFSLGKLLPNIIHRLLSMR